MKFAWLGDDLHETCRSEKRLRQRFGDAASAVKVLLTALSQADSLGDVRAFRSLQLLLIPPTKKHQGRLLIRHKEIDMTMELLTADDRVIYEAERPSASWIDPISHVRVISINSNA